MKFAIVAAAAAVPLSLGATLKVNTELAARLAQAEEAFLSKRPHHHRHGEPNAKVRKDIDTELKHIMNVGDSADLSEYVGKLEHLEASLGSFANKELMAEIGTMRLQICEGQGFDKHEMSDCETFMGVACSLEGGGNPKQSVPEDTCNRFYLKHHQFMARSTASSGHKQKNHKAKFGRNETGNATEAEGLFGAKKERPIAEQGYNEYVDGKLVEHNDLETYTKDWQKEGQGRDIDTICKEFPNNQWCQLHTQSAPPPEEPYFAPAPAPKSGSTRCYSSALGTVAVLLAAAALQ
eukprot:TRINITY_DN6525_c0_g1_i1.p1 TRINITY_DN6525_c0_g1~~TRINITY_DN6525_c0_g1_i1.p1  ORF type:complete len:293 (+),score=104.23 TRINITY_DN6525_c0_g1_i1:76-954(+)